MKPDPDLLGPSKRLFRGRRVTWPTLIPGSLGIDSLYLIGPLTRSGGTFQIDGTPVLEASIRPHDPSRDGLPGSPTPPERDPAWRARLRSHQAWYREAVLGLPPGEMKAPGGTRPVTSLLPRWAVAEDPTLNFLCREDSHGHALGRLTSDGGGIIEPERLFHNLLSSQPLCFNLFAPLHEAGVLAETLESVLHLGIERVVDLRFEFQPRPADDFRTGSAFDCYVAYEYDGGLGFLGIETKYAEDLSQQRPSARPDYAAYTDTAADTFKPGASAALVNAATCQLWYNAVLARRWRFSAQGFSAGRVLVLACESDTSASTAVDDVRTHLVSPDDTMLHVGYETLVDAVPTVGALGSWREQFSVRYLDFERSASAPS
jgi:hypothetical protein